MTLLGLALAPTVIVLVLVKVTLTWLRRRWGSLDRVVRLAAVMVVVGLPAFTIWQAWRIIFHPEGISPQSWVLWGFQIAINVVATTTGLIAVRRDDEESQCPLEARVTNTCLPPHAGVRWGVSAGKWSQPPGDQSR